MCVNRTVWIPWGRESPRTEPAVSREQWDPGPSTPNTYRYGTVMLVRVADLVGSGPFLPDPESFSPDPALDSDPTLAM